MRGERDVGRVNDNAISYRAGRPENEIHLVMTPGTGHPDAGRTVPSFQASRWPGRYRYSGDRVLWTEHASG